MPYATNNGTRIYWDSKGEGEPLLLIQGLGVTHDMWYRLTPLLEHKYRVIMFDNRGVGKTDQPEGPYRIADMADDAAAVISAAGVESAFVCGISMGGMIAQELTLRHPQLVRKVILGCTVCGGKQSVPAAKEVTEILLARGTMSPEEAGRAMAPYIYAPTTPRQRVEEDLAVRLCNAPTDAAYLAQLGGIRGWQSYDRLPSFATPTLVLHGDCDQLVPPENGHILARTIPGARFVLLEQASHLFWTDQPEKSAEAMLQFFGSAA